MSRLTYTEAVERAATLTGCPGWHAEAYELEAYTRNYMQAEIDAQVARMARRLYSTGEYNIEKAWWHWEAIADRASLAYSAPALYYGHPDFKPAARHTIDRDSRQMTALYLERRWRSDVFQAAGVPMPASLVADCNPLED